MAAVRFLIQREDLGGVVNLSAPGPLTNEEFMKHLHDALGAKTALPVPGWALEVGAFLMRTETELILKSRRVVSRRLLENGFKFRYPTWPEAAVELIGRWKKRGR